MQFPTPPMSMRKRDKIVNEACVIAAEGQDNAAIDRMACTLSARIPTLDPKGALRLLASIGLTLTAHDRPSTTQIEKAHQ